MMRPLLRLPLHRRLHTLPTTPRIPPPTCPCRATPATSLPIDHDTPILNSAPGYTHHILLPTSLPPDSWPSKIDVASLPPKSSSASTDATTPPTAASTIAASAQAIKKAVRAGQETGLVTTAFPPPPGIDEAGAVVLPEGRVFRSVEELEGWLKRGYGAEVGGEKLPESLKAVVLVCVHGTRDARCGEMGEALLEQFHDVCGALSVGPAGGAGSAAIAGSGDVAEEGEARRGGVWILGCSHLSGHKWAGNVVVYRRKEGEDGWWGVWYGRVTPREVEAIVTETVQGGRVLGEGTGVLRGVLGGVVEGEDTVISRWEGKVKAREIPRAVI